jgi:hypothetical protein
MINMTLCFIGYSPCQRSALVLPCAEDTTVLSRRLWRMADDALRTNYWLHAAESKSRMAQQGSRENRPAMMAEGYRAVHFFWFGLPHTSL